MTSPISRGLDGATLNAAVATVTVAGNNDFSATGWRDLGAKQIKVTIGGKSFDNIAPNFGPLVANHLDVARAIEAAINAPEKFGSNAVTVSYDPALARFIFVSNTLLPITVEAGAANSLFAAGPKVHFDKVSDIRDVTKQDTVTIMARGSLADRGNAAAWARLADTTAIAVFLTPGSGRFVNLNFTTAASMDDVPTGVAGILKAAINGAGGFGANVVTVTWDAATLLFTIRTTGGQKIQLTDQHPDDRKSLFAAELPVGLLEVDNSANYSRGLDATLVPGGAPTDISDHRQWKALGNDKVLWAVIGDKRLTLAPDFTTIPDNGSMNDVAMSGSDTTVNPTLASRCHHWPFRSRSRRMPTTSRSRSRSAPRRTRRNTDAGCQGCCVGCAACPPHPLPSDSSPRISRARWPSTAPSGSTSRPKPTPRRTSRWSS
jgi:hypothetical protein